MLNVKNVQFRSMQAGIFLCRPEAENQKSKREDWSDISSVTMPVNTFAFYIQHFTFNHYNVFWYASMAGSMFSATNSSALPWCRITSRTSVDEIVEYCGELVRKIV